MSLQICIPGPSHLVNGRGRPYYYLKERAFDIITLEEVRPEHSAELTVQASMIVIKLPLKISPSKRWTCHSSQ